MIHETDRYGSTTGSAPLSRGPQPGWMTFNQARDRGFTGEIVFELEPEVRAYLDNGAVYFAERASGPSITEQLVESGVIDQGQIERGTVRVGDVEHLGRLFEREPSVDRDAVLVVTESLTDQVVTELANEVITTVRSTAYRHHPSGLHRWFAVPVETTAEFRPGIVSSLEASSLDDLPGLPLMGDHLITDQLYIEWDEPFLGRTPEHDSVVEEALIEEFDDSMLEALLDQALAEEAAEAAVASALAAAATVEEIVYDEAIEDLDDLIDLDELIDLDDLGVLGDQHVGALVEEEPEPELTIDFQSARWPIPDTVVHPSAERTRELPTDDFEVVWPTGETEVILVDAPHVNGVSAPSGVPTFEAPVPMAAAAGEPTTTDELTMTPIETFDVEIVAEVPADVADAVRRALAALEAATTGEVPVVPSIPQPSEFEEPGTFVAAPSAPAVAAAPAFAGFAPPSLDMSAEAIYARMVAEHAASYEVPEQAETVSPQAPAVELAGDPAEPYLPTSGSPSMAPAAGVASVVFVDDEPAEDSQGGPNERKSALRRLIGSLGRKDR